MIGGFSLPIPALGILLWLPISCVPPGLVGVTSTLEDAGRHSHFSERARLLFEERTRPYLPGIGGTIRGLLIREVSTSPPPRFKGQHDMFVQFNREL